MNLTRPVSWLSLVAAGVLLSACAGTELAIHAAKRLDVAVEGEPSGGTYKVGKPYKVDGVWYYPAEAGEYDETGIASWYGEHFHGRYTANGEVFDMNALTAAHKTLPLPSIVRVTNLGNGRSLVVRVNDRGPFVNGRLIDLSRRSAQLLGFEANGTAKVRVQLLPNESYAARLVAQGRTPSTGKEEEEAAPTKVAAAPVVPVTRETLAPPPGMQAAPERESQRQVALRESPDAVLDNTPQNGIPEPLVTVEPVKPTSIFIQAGAFAVYDNANRLRARLSALAPTRISPVMVDGQQFFRVRLGPIGSVPAADALLERLINAGYTQARVVVE